MAAGRPRSIRPYGAARAGDAHDPSTSWRRLEGCRADAAFLAQLEHLS